MEKKKKAKFVLAIISIIIVIGFCVLYATFWNDLIVVLKLIKGVWLTIVSSIIRIIILAIMSSILFIRWFKQGKIYTSDAYFLFAMFFSILLVGKIYDLFINLITFNESISTGFILLITKIRYLIITLNITPVLYIGLEAILAFLIAYIENINQSQFNKIRLGILGIYLLIVLMIIIIAPTLNMLIYALPYFTIGLYFVIAIMFLFMYRNKRLSQANALLIGTAFIFLIISSIIRSFITVIALENPSVFVIAEIFDVIVNFVIFLGFLTKPKYAKF